MAKKFIFGILAIVIILAVVYFSQKGAFGGTGKTLVSDAANQAQAYLSAGTNWAAANVYPKITGEVQAKGDMVKTVVGQTQKNVSENIAQKISN